MMDPTDRVVVLYLDRWCTLWGVPYAMCTSVGQTPRHLQEAGRMQGWIWLGSPGWWGHLSPVEIVQTKAFLEKYAEFVPRNLYEFARLPDRTCGRGRPSEAPGTSCVLYKGHDEQHASEGFCWSDKVGFKP